MGIECFRPHCQCAAVRRQAAVSRCALGQGHCRRIRTVRPPRIWFFSSRLGTVRGADIRTPRGRAGGLRVVGTWFPGHDVSGTGSQLFGRKNAADHRHGAGMAVRAFSQRLSRQRLETVAVVSGWIRPPRFGPCRSAPGTAPAFVRDGNCQGSHCSGCGETRLATHGSGSGG